jgi:hypothetical protein
MAGSVQHRTEKGSKKYNKDEINMKINYVKEEKLRREFKRRTT